MVKATEQAVVMVRARAFSGEGVRWHKAMVGRDGSVAVWDSVAGHYTVCHAMCRRAIRRARHAAAPILGELARIEREVGQ